MEDDSDAEFSQDTSSDDGEECTIIEVRESPKKFQRAETKLFKGNDKCRLVNIDSLDNTDVAPLLMNAREDSPHLVSTAVPSGIQENANLIIDLDSLTSRNDVFCDDNGVWKMTGAKLKFFKVHKVGTQVVSIEKVTREEEADVSIRRRTYIAQSCTTYHRTIVSVEYGRDIQKWFPVVLLSYRFDGPSKKFNPGLHGNRKGSSSVPYVRTKPSTKSKLAENVSDGKTGPKRALFSTVRDVGGIIDVDSTSTLPRNVRQVYYEKQKAAADSGTKRSKDVLASVLDLQKGSCKGFIREVSCNDLPSVILFTDKQINDIVKFCCHQQTGMVSELGADITFQLGPFYLLVTTYKNTFFKVKGSEHSPSFLGPVMICMTKEENTYLSLMHCLLREVPGFSQYLHAYGTDNESALVNALAAAFQQGRGLLCYIHIKKNISMKLQKMGLSVETRQEICRDIFSKPRGLLYEESSNFLEKASRLMMKWDELETKERHGTPQFSSYFKKHHLNDLKNKTAKFVMQEMGLGEDPYSQNIPEAVNKLIKDWVNFLPSEIDSFVLSLHELIISFQTEEELTWFGLSDKWEVKLEHVNRLPSRSHLEMTPDERRATLNSLSKQCPDPDAFQRCKRFKFQTGQTLNALDKLQCSTKDSPLLSRRDLDALKGSFTEEELLSLAAKSGALLHSDAIRNGFQQRTFLVDSKRPPPNISPYTVTCLKSGKCTCECAFYGRNNVCSHTIAVAWKAGILSQVLTSYMGRNMYSISTSTVSSAVGKKQPVGRKRKNPIHNSESSCMQTGSEFVEGSSATNELCVQPVNPTTLVIKKAVRPEDPPPAAPLILKRISGNIRKCAGCTKPLSSQVEGFWGEEDADYCCGRYEAYYFWNKGSNSYQLSSGTRYYHINPVCTRMFRSANKTISLGPGIRSTDAICQIAVKRFGVNISL